MPSSVCLSILIPVYNWDVRLLLNILHQQCSTITDSGSIEIRVLDDGSSEKFDIVSLAAELSLVTYEEFTENQGRVAVRNALLDKAKGEYVLFLDSDMLPDQDNFIRTYLDYAHEKYDIVCGGISYLQSNEADTSSSFYLYKSRKTEALSAEVRSSAPWRYLFTSNCMLRREIVTSIRFDSRFKGYGFEDIEWAIRLATTYTIKHVDNTCSHMGVMSKAKVCLNMRNSIENYRLLLDLHPQETAGSGAVRYAGLLKSLPVFLLSFTDRALSRLFLFFSWNPLLFLVFQCDKVVLLARALKTKQTGRFP